MAMVLGGNKGEQGILLPVGSKHSACTERVFSGRPEHWSEECKKGMSIREKLMRITGKYSRH